MFLWLRPFEIYFLDDKCNIGEQSSEVGDKRQCLEKEGHGTCINEDDSKGLSGFQCLCKPQYLTPSLTSKPQECKKGSYN